MPMLPRSALVLGGAALILAAAACADTGPTAPASTRPAPRSARTSSTVTSTVTSTTGGAITSTTTTVAGTTTTVTSTVSTTLTAVTALLWVKPVTGTTVSAVIGPQGGSLAIANGLRLTVPANAVRANTAFSITRLPGSVVAYNFEPHGTRFAVPLVIEQPAAGTNLALLGAASIQGAYFLDASHIDQARGRASVAEFEPTTVSSDRSTIRFTVSHFSGYMMSSGRY